jgi:hypothetical protein
MIGFRFESAWIKNCDFYYDRLAARGSFSSQIAYDGNPNTHYHYRVFK